MTVYRYVRTGRLLATKANGTWRIRRRDLDVVRAAPNEGDTRQRRQDQLEARLVAGDEAGAWTLIEQALSLRAPAAIHHELLIPAMESIGDRWASDDLTVLDEHRATACAHRLVARLGPLLRAPATRRLTVVVGAPSGDHHGLGLSILSDLVMNEGFATIELGADTPAEAFVDTLAEVDGSAAVVVMVHAPGCDEQITAIDRAIAEHDPNVALVVAGPTIPEAITPRPAEARYLAPSVTEVLSTLDDLTSSSSAGD